MADRKRGRHSEDDCLRAAGLIPMEEEIFGRLGRGMTRREICRELGIGHSCYDNHVRMGRRCRGVRTTVEAVAVYMWLKARREKEEEEEEE